MIQEFLGLTVRGMMFYLSIMLLALIFTISATLY